MNIKIETLLERMIYHLSAKDNKKPYEIRKEFIEVFTPVLKSLNDEYSFTVQQIHIEKFGFRFSGYSSFMNYLVTYLDNNKNLITFNHKTNIMTISNADLDDFYLIKNAKIPNLLAFESIMFALGFEYIK